MWQTCGVMKNMNYFFTFRQPLIEGVIRSRPNRFLMNVEVNGVDHLAHCPVTGKIWNIDFEDSNIPCLLSQPEMPISSSKKRKTSWTVEAISMQLPKEKEKTWIGINQSKVNSYIEHFLMNTNLQFAPPGEIVKREVKIGQSRLDFQLGTCLLCFICI